MQQTLLRRVTWKQQLVYFTESCNSTYYEILGISKNATQAEIKTAYYERSKELHPDRKNCSNDQEAKRRNDAFVELTRAYEVLKIPERRQSYDMSLGGNRIFADCVERSSFDELFTHSQCTSREKPTSLAERYNEFWQNFGVFGYCLRFLTQSLITSGIVVGILLKLSDL